LGNPAATEVNRRYIDRDLNRCFQEEDLNNPRLGTYEDQRAREINAQLGPKSSPQVDFIIDLHSTTTNMGLSILPASRDRLNLQLAAYLTQVHPAVKVSCGMRCGQNSSLLRSLSPHGCTIEVGPIAQGVLDATLFQHTERMIHATLDYLEALNQDKLDHLEPIIPAQFDLYQAIANVDYPRDPDGHLQAMVHPDRQFRDYQPLQPGDPLFVTFDGETLPYEGDQTVYPIFINEAAYYEKGIAMILTQRETIMLETVAP
jgi:aspartoacylase